MWVGKVESGVWVGKVESDVWVGKVESDVWVGKVESDVLVGKVESDVWVGKVESDKDTQQRCRQCGQNGSHGDGLLRILQVPRPAGARQNPFV